jgi:uncharacterized membrane protein YfcA
MMEWSMFLLAATGFFLAGIVKGATGLGYTSCALPFLVSTIGLKPAMALVLVPAMATNVSLAFTTGHLVETARRFSNLYLAMIPGIAIGIYLLLWISPSVAVKTLGTIIIGYVALTLLRPRYSLSASLERLLQFPTGFLNGVLTGLTGSQVMPLLPYMMSLELDPNRMVQAINLAVMIASAAVACGLIATGVMTVQLLGISFIAIVPALLGAEIGARARKRIPVSQFRLGVLVVLLMMGTLMIVR